jgi:hypothetical protein
MIRGRKPFSASAVRSKFTGETPRALDMTFREVRMDRQNPRCPVCGPVPVKAI